MVYVYPACFYREKDGKYSVIFNDFESSTCGDTLEEAYTMAQDLLGGLIISAQDEGEALPKASDIKDVKLSDEWEYESAFVSLVSVDSNNYRKQVTKSVKKTLTIPAWLNEIAEDRHINFSSILQEALKRQLGL